MKPSSFTVFTLAILISILYFGGYAGLYALAGSRPDNAAFGSDRPAIRVYPNQVSILTRDQPAVETAVKLFEPVMFVHGRLSGTTFHIAAHEFS